MAIVLSHISAYEFWRQAVLSNGKLKFPRFNGYVVVPYKRSALPRSSYSELRSVNAKLLCEEYKISSPIHVTVDNANKRYFDDEIVSHTWDKRFPAETSIKINAGLYVLSPEVCFAHMSRYVDSTNLIRIGFELCGLYAFKTSDSAKEQETSIIQREPLTTINKIANTLRNSKGAKGSNRARKALRYVLNYSASPRETALAMILALPYSMGGFALPSPDLNEIRSVRTASKTTLGKSHLFCDLLWKDKRLIVEYDSAAFHSETDQIEKDSKRRNELSALGYDVITVTTKQLNSVKETKQVAKDIGSKLGKRIRPSIRDFEMKHIGLRNRVLASQIAYVRK